MKHLIETMQSERGEASQFQFGYQQVFNEFKNVSTLMVTRDMFDDALRSLQE